MPKCEMLETCIFFNDQMPDMPSTASVIKLKYCTGDNSECARFMVWTALGRGTVPADLFPTQSDRAREIIKAG